MKSKSGIYQWRNIINGKIYVGSAQDMNHRKNDHVAKLRHNKHCNKKLQSGFNKYGMENFVFEILEVVNDLSELTKREQAFIDLLNPFYNLRRIAESNRGYKMSDTAKKNIVNAIIGRKHSEETKKILSIKKIGNKNGVGNKNNLGRVWSKEIIEKRAAANRGKRRTFTEQHKKNMSIGQTGKRFTDEHRLKISKALLGNKRALKKKDILHG